MQVDLRHQTRNPHQAHKYSLAWMLDPITPEVFFRDYYEKKILRIHRDNPTYYHNVLTLADVDQILADRELRFPDVRMVSSNGFVNQNDYTRGNGTSWNAEKGYKLFQQGNTISLNGMHRELPRLADFVDSLVQQFNHKLQTNLYLTPGRSQGFKVHYDDHDVFILQIEGSKLWKIYEPYVALPTKNMPFENHYEATPFVEEFLLNPGDFLYVPRGVMHEAIAQDGISLHITAGMIGYTWADLLIEQIHNLTLRDVNFRGYLPSPWFHDPAARAGSREYLLKLLDIVRDNLDTEAGYDRFGQELMATMDTRFPNMLTTLPQLSQLSVNSQFVRRPNILFRRLQLDNQYGVQFHAKDVKFPAFCQAIVDYICDEEGPMRIGNLPQVLDDNGKVELVRRLAKEGFVEILEA